MPLYLSVRYFKRRARSRTSTRTRLQRANGQIDLDTHFIAHKHD